MHSNGASASHVLAPVIRRTGLHVRPRGASREINVPPSDARVHDGRDKQVRPEHVLLRLFPRPGIRGEIVENGAHDGRAFLVCLFHDARDVRSKPFAHAQVLFKYPGCLFTIAPHLVRAAGKQKVLEGPRGVP